MSEQEPKRTDRMHDGKFIPKPGVEQDILTQLGVGEERSLDDLLSGLNVNNYKRKSEVLDGVWRLIDRGYVELTVDRKLKGHEKPIYPAPNDIL